MAPYCPKSDERTLDFDLRQGYQVLDDTYDEDASLPFTTDDIQITTEEAVPTVADWLVEELQKLKAKQAHSPTTEIPEEASSPQPQVKKPRGKSAQTTQNLPGAIAAALAGGDLPEVRAQLNSALSEIKGTKKKRIRPGKGTPAHPLGASTGNLRTGRPANTKGLGNPAFAEYPDGCAPPRNRHVHPGDHSEKKQPPQ